MNLDNFGFNLEFKNDDCFLKLSSKENGKFKSVDSVMDYLNTVKIFGGVIKIVLKDKVVGCIFHEKENFKLC